MSEDKTLDYYELLGVPVNASHEQIKSAYRQLAKEWHPDHNADALAPDAMLLLNEAWEVLGDEKLRADYDRQRALARSNVAEAARQRQQQKTEKAENEGAWSSGIVEPPWYRATEDEIDSGKDEEALSKKFGSRSCWIGIGLVIVIILVGVLLFGNEPVGDRGLNCTEQWERLNYPTRYSGEELSKAASNGLTRSECRDYWDSLEE